MLRRGFIDLDNYSKVLVSGRGSCFTRKQRKTVLDTVGMIMSRSVEAAIRGEN